MSTQSQLVCNLRHFHATNLIKSVLRLNNMREVTGDKLIFADGLFKLCITIYHNPNTNLIHVEGTTARCGH